MGSWFTKHSEIKCLGSGNGFPKFASTGKKPMWSSTNSLNSSFAIFNDDLVHEWFAVSSNYSLTTSGSSDKCY